jgi:hypothetical protein
VAERSPTNLGSLAPLFLVSLTGIGYEIALTRFFAVAEWSDYGYWVISIAMAGFALSGVVLALCRDTAARHGPAILAVLPTLLILAAAAGFTAAAVNPFNPLQLQNPVTWQSQLWNIGAYYAALLPFFFLAGLFVSLSFVLNAARIGAVYAADLTGAGLGAAGILAVMFVLHPFHLVPALLVPLALAAILIRRKAAVLAAVMALLAGEALLLFGPQAAISQFKPIYPPLHTPNARVVGTHLSPAGAYSLLDDFTERLDTDLSNNAEMLGFGTPPRTYGLYRDGDRIAALPQTPINPDGKELAYAPATLDALPYSVVPHGNVLLIGAGGGYRIAQALRLGAAHVAVVEPEPLLRSALRHGFGPTPPFPADLAVKVIPEPPLAAVRNGARYELIDLAANLLSASPAAQTAFSAQAIAADLHALMPGGVISIPVSIREFPVYALRMLATARDAFRVAGIPDPGAHAIMYRSAWNVRLLLSNEPFDAAAIAVARKFCDDRSFDVSWYPGINVVAQRGNIYNDLPAVSFTAGEVSSAGPDDSIADEAAAVLGGAPTASAAAFDLSPITVDRPAFFSVLRLSHLGLLLKRLEVLPQQEIGALVNLAVLAQAGLSALAVLLLPLAAPRRLRPEQGGWAWAVGYFPALALGFLFIEIALIQTATDWLDDKTSGFAVVLTGMLIFSGLGSAASSRFSGGERGAITMASLLVIGWTGAMLVGLQPLMLATLGAPVGIRLVLFLAVTAPVGLLLGLFFPLGLARVGQGGALPWAWALNGAFSVLATPLANLIAREFGFSRVLLCAALMYGLAALAFPAARRCPQWFTQPVRLPGAD